MVFSCEFCEISENILFAEHPWTTASVAVESNLKRTVCGNLKASVNDSTTSRLFKTFGNFHFSYFPEHLRSTS